MTRGEVSESPEAHGSSQSGPVKKPASWAAAGIFPLLILFGLNMVDEFDRVAFGTLTPEIRNHFRLSDSDFVFISTLSAALALLLAVPIGYLADRRNRVRISQIAGIVWGFAAVATGLAPAVVVLMIARFAGGVGRLVNEPVHPSLLSDYYAPSHLPRIFAIHRFANNLGLIAGPVAGVMAGAFEDWRAVFIILAVPTGLLLILSTKLREPRRGSTLGREMDDERVPFFQAFRRLASIRSLRRTWLAAFFFGSGTIPLASILSIFFERIYGVGTVGRGNIQLINGVGGAIGLVVGQRLARRVLGTGRPELIVLLTGLLVVEFGVGLALMGLAPSLTASLFFVVILAIGAQGFLPPYLTIVSLISHPRIRSQAYSYSLFFFALGGVILARTTANIGERLNWRLGAVVLAGFVALGGLIGTTARRFIRDDVERAFAPSANS